MKDNDFLKLIKTVEPEYDEAEIITTSFLDTGSYAMNALISGSVYGGFPSNRVVVFSGEAGVGKTYFAMSAIKAFQDKYVDGNVIYFDTEFALDKEFFRKRGLDEKRIAILGAETLQNFRTKCLNIIKNYEDQTDKKPLMIVLDSLSQLPSNKELDDGIEGKDVSDMTKSKLIRSIFRSVTMKIGKLNIPMIVVAHSYSIIGAYVPTTEVSGGGGVKYAASCILEITKKKDKDGNVVIGNILGVKTKKSRYSKENQRVDLKLDFRKGIDRYYGLLDLAEKYDIIKKVSTRYQLPDGTKVWGKDINGDPEKYYTKEILDQLDIAAKKEYSLGEMELDDIPLEDIEEDVLENEVITETTEE